MLTTNGSLIWVFGNDIKFCHPHGIHYAGSGIHWLGCPVILIGIDDCVYMVSVDETSASMLPGSFDCPCRVIMMDDGQIVVATYKGNKLTVI